MTEQQQVADTAPAWAPQPQTPAAPTVSQPPAGSTAPAADRPELAVAGAFAGGFLLAFVLKRLARK